MAHLKQVQVTVGDEALMAPSGEEMRLPDGRTAQGFRPLDREDPRYYERITLPDGRIQWYQLVEEHEHPWAPANPRYRVPGPSGRWGGD